MGSEMCIRDSSLSLSLSLSDSIDEMPDVDTIAWHIKDLGAFARETKNESDCSYSLPKLTFLRILITKSLEEKARN